MPKVQILYSKDLEEDKIHRYVRKEAEYMGNKGFIVGTSIIKGCTQYIYRGLGQTVIPVYSQFYDYPWVNSIYNFENTNDMSKFLNIIKPWTFPSEIVNELNETVLKKLQHDFSCNKLFIKNDYSSLFSINEGASVYPVNGLSMIKHNFNSLGLKPPFIVRKYIEDKEIFYNEQRVWILNGNVYFTAPSMPNFIFEAAKKIYEFSGSKYFVIDVAGDYIVEVNPGESSDRGGFNSLDWFCDIFAKEFLSK